MAFSSAGEFLLVPAGIVELGEPEAKSVVLEEKDDKEPMEVDLEEEEVLNQSKKIVKDEEEAEDPTILNACYLFYRNDLTK